MTEVFVIVFLVMIVAVILMAIGTLSGREPIKGSCGGLNNIGIEKACGCTDNCVNENTLPEELSKPEPPKKIEKTL